MTTAELIEVLKTKPQDEPVECLVVGSGGEIVCMSVNRHAESMARAMNSVSRLGGARGVNAHD